MAIIEPLSLETWIVNVFAGSFEIFTAVALLFIAGMAGFFRMTGTTLMFMVAIFFVMFSGYVDKSIIFLIISLGGLLIGYWVSKIVKS